VLGIVSQERDAYRLIGKFTQDEQEAEAIARFLSEYSSGDEYEMLSDDEWELGEKYLSWLRARGVMLFAPPHLK
jgi:hypothetical protein